jgi:hypothetical protein
MPRLPASLLAVGLAATTVGLVACGGEDAKLLPGETAREITANLETVKQLADEGDCLGAESAAGQVSEQVEELGGVDRKLKQALREGAARLNEVVAGCEESSTEAISPAEIPAEEETGEKPSKAEKKEEKEREKEEKAPPPTPEEAEGSPQLPPQAKGEGKGLENGNSPPEAGGEEGPAEAPSGGVGPGSPAGEGG